jgi:hypothetical protein
VAKGSDSLCVAKTSGFSIPMQNPAPQGEKVAHWLKGGEWDAYCYDYFFCYCLLHIMVQPALETE